MPIDIKQLVTEIILPALEESKFIQPGITSPTITRTQIRLLLLSAATETDMGTYIRQRTNSGVGPARGLYGMEPATFKDVWIRTKQRMDNSKFFKNIYFVAGSPNPETDADKLIWDMRLATISARLKYYLITTPLPNDNLEELAHYYKIYYNSIDGAGSVQKAITDYNRYVAPYWNMLNI
jgi:hypothetical protein